MNAYSKQPKNIVIQNQMKNIDGSDYPQAIEFNNYLGQTGNEYKELSNIVWAEFISSDLVLLFGRQPTSTVFLFSLKENKILQQEQVDFNPDWTYLLIMVEANEGHIFYLDQNSYLNIMIIRFIPNMTFSQVLTPYTPSLYRQMKQSVVIYEGNYFSFCKTKNEGLVIIKSVRFESERVKDFVIEGNSLYICSVDTIINLSLIDNSIISQLNIYDKPSLSGTKIMIFNDNLVFQHYKEIILFDTKTLKYRQKLDDINTSLIYGKYTYKLNDSELLIVTISYSSQFSCSVYKQMSGEKLQKIRETMIQPGFSTNIVCYSQNRLIAVALALFDGLVFDVV